MDPLTGKLEDAHTAIPFGGPRQPRIGGWPTKTQLKRLRVVTTKKGGITTPCVVTFMIRLTTTQQHFNNNIMLNSYKHPTLDGVVDGEFSYRNLCKAWRSSLHDRHRHTSEFARATFGNPNYDLSVLTTQYNRLMITGKRRETLWKLMNNSLYVGIAAIDYQTNIKHVPIGSHKRQAPLCIYSAHAFDQQYRPRTRPWAPANVVPTYEHIFWTGQIAKLIWKQADDMTLAMQIGRVTAGLLSYRHIFKTIEMADLDDEHVMIKVNIMIEVLWTLYAKEKELNDLYQNGANILTDEEVDSWPERTSQHFKRQLLDHAFAHRHNMRAIRERKKLTRSKMLTDTKHYAKLSDEETRMYNLSWVRTELVQITNGALVVKPHRREPP
jgi:hypothetical protein